MSIATLANYIREKMDARGWSQTDLAAESGVPKTTLNNILNKQVALPELPTFVKLAAALEVPLRTLLEVAGISVDPPSDPSDMQRRLSAYLEAAPWLQPVMERLTTLDPDDRASFLAYLDALDRRTREQRSG